MKLRVRQNSIRLRLGQSEVDRLREGQDCREEVRFPGSGRLEYRLQAFSGATVQASLCGSNIVIEVPERELARWCNSQQVGISAKIQGTDETSLSILIEKDFRCLDPLVPEDQSDTFANPLGTQHAACNS